MAFDLTLFERALDLLLRNPIAIHFHDLAFDLATEFGLSAHARALLKELKASPNGELVRTAEYVGRGLLHLPMAFRVQFFNVGKAAVFELFFPNSLELLKGFAARRINSMHSLRGQAESPFLRALWPPGEPLHCRGWFASAILQFDLR